MYIIVSNFLSRFVINNWFEKLKNNYLHMVLIFLITLLLSFEFFVFGTNSLVVIYDEADTFFPLYKVLSENPNRDILFSFSGGLFKNGVMFDSKFISLQIFLVKILSPFWGYAFIKFLNSCFVVVGFWLITNNNIKETTILSFIYYGSMAYISTISMVHMSGYSAIPLTIYLLYQFKTKSIFQKNIILIFYFLFISISSSLPHSIMAHLSAIISGLFLYKINTTNVLFCIKGVILIVVLSIINHYPVIEFTLNNKDILFRTTKEFEPVNLYNLFLQPLLEFISKSRGFFILGLGLVLIVYLNIILKRKIKIISILLPYLFSILLKLLLSMEIFSFLSSLRTEQIMLSIPSLIVIGFYHILKEHKNIHLFQKLKPKHFILIIFSYYVCDTKFTHFLHWQGEGSFKSNFIINENLKNFMIKQKIYTENDPHYLSNFRSVVVPTKLTPGILWYNQINSFDGYSSFFPKKRAEKWMEVFKSNNHDEQYITKRYFIKLKNINSKKSFLDNKEISFLRTHGVRYYFSSIPLNETNLKLVFEKTFKEKTDNFSQIHISNFKRNLNEMEFFVYEDEDYDPVIYVTNNKTKYLCRKKLKIKKENDHLSIDLSECPFLDKTEGTSIILSLPNFEEIEIENNEINYDSKLNKDLLFKIPINNISGKVILKPVS